MELPVGDLADTRRDSEQDLRLHCQWCRLSTVSADGARALGLARLQAATIRKVTTGQKPARPP